MTAEFPKGQPACRARTRVLDAGFRSLKVIDPFLSALPLRSPGVGSLAKLAVPSWLWLYTRRSIVAVGLAPVTVTEALPVALMVCVFTVTATALLGQPAGDV